MGLGRIHRSVLALSVLLGVALASLEVARAEAQRKQRYLIAFVAPLEPDEATEPERLINTIAVFFGLLLAFVIGALAVSAIQDHANL